MLRFGAFSLEVNGLYDPLSKVQVGLTPRVMQNLNMAHTKLVIKQKKHYYRLIDVKLHGKSVMKTLFS